jgi:signal peptidase II
MKSSTRIFFLWAFILIAFDQITKLLTKGFNIFGFSREGMRLGESVDVMGDFLRFTFVENPGMAFGIEFGWGKIFLSLFSIFAVIALAWYLFKIDGYDKFARTGIMLIFAGAAGNMIDRVFYGVFYGESALFYGKVVDFVQVDIPDVDLFGLYYSHWPVFNIADSCVFCGVALLIFFHDKLPSLDELKNRNKNNDMIEEEETENLIDI